MPALDPLGLLEGLLALYSPSHQEADSVEFLVAQMSHYGFAAHIDPAGNAVGVLGEGPADVMLLGHIDTVPGFIPVRRVGDRLYGRGAVDAKGPLAAFVSAVVRAGRIPDRRFIVVGAVGEEADSRGAQYIADRYYGAAGAMARAGEAAPACLIIGEPSGWERVTLGYKGSVWLEYSMKQAVAHSAGREQSAADVALDFWNAVRAYAEEYNRARGAERVFDRLTLTLREMRTDSDGFVECATLGANLRLPPGLGVRELVTVLEGLAGEADLSIAAGAVPAYRAEKNTPLVRAFIRAIRAEGGAPGFTVKTGSSDMNLVAPGWGCATVAYGPGDSALDHTPEEHIQTSDYVHAISVLAGCLADPDLITTARVQCG